MPYATNNGFRIYYEREGRGPALVLHAGLTQSLCNWRDYGGYVDALKGDYDLILMDPLGHGGSDKPHDPAAYAYANRVADVLAVLDDAEVARAIFWGYSLGGDVAYAAARYAPGRFRAFIVGGASPYPSDPARQRERAEGLRRPGAIADYVAGLERRIGPLPARSRAALFANDVEALVASMLASAEEPDYAEVLAQLTSPMLIYLGEHDSAHASAQRAASRHPLVTFVTLPGLEHGQAAARSDVVLPHVRAFLAGVAGRGRMLRYAQHDREG